MMGKIKFLMEKLGFKDLESFFFQMFEFETSLIFTSFGFFQDFLWILIMFWKFFTLNGFENLGIDVFS
jgi:hypothetical protein